MNLIKDKNDYGYLQEILEEDHSLGYYIDYYLGKLLHGGLSKILGGVKLKGYGSKSILTLLIVFPLMNCLTTHQFFSSKFSTLIHGKKDVVYRFKNNCKIPWRKVLYSIVKRFLKQSGPLCQENTKKSSKSFKCLIFDDTTIDKTGNKIEFISRVFNHVTKKSNLGQKLLTMVYWTGNSLIPIDFSIHRESGSKKKLKYGLKTSVLKKMFTKKRSTKDASYERVEEVDKKKTTVMLEMIKRAVKNKIDVDYILSDSWFFSFDLLSLVSKLKINLVCRAKIAPMKFTYLGKDYTAKSLVSILSRNKKYSRKLKSHYIDIQVRYKGIPCRIYLIRFGNQKNWNLLLSSNTKLTFVKAMEIYQIRWGIEVFFKESKQYLGLAKCQSLDFDAHIAHVSTVFIAYIALALKKVADSQQTIGQLFSKAKNDFLELCLDEKLWSLFIKLIKSIFVYLELNIFDAIKKIFNLNKNHEFMRLLKASFD